MWSHETVITLVYHEYHSLVTRPPSFVLINIKTWRPGNEARCTCQHAHTHPTIYCILLFMKISDRNFSKSIYYRGCPDSVQHSILVHHSNHLTMGVTRATEVVASFPGPCPASCCLQYGKAGVTHVRKCTRPSSALPYCNWRKAGRGPGNEATEVA